MVKRKEKKRITKYKKVTGRKFILEVTMVKEQLCCDSDVRVITRKYQRNLLIINL